MSNVQETVVVEAITQYGIKANGRFLNISPNLKNSGVKPTNFNVGETYLVEIYTGPKGGKSINSYAAVTPTPVAQVPVTVPAPYIPPPPSLPVTSLPSTPAPGGELPIKPANKNVENSDSEKMSKQDWKNKDEAIELVAIIKSTLESPSLAQLVVGKNNRDAFITTRDYIKYNLETLELAKNKSL